MAPVEEVLARIRCAFPANTRAKGVGLWHGGANVVVVLLFVVSWLLRLPAPRNPGPLPFILSLLGVGLALVTSWLGGELVERLGVGVDAGANLDAPSSLSGRPATASGRPPNVPPEQTRRTT